MIFGITEEGDLFLDSENMNITNIIYGEYEETLFKKSKSIVIDYFVLRRNFQDNFIMYERNNFEDSEVEEMIDKHLSSAFLKEPDCLPKISYSFINKGREFEILFVFTFESGEVRTLLLKEIKI